VAWSELGLVRRAQGKFPEARLAYQQAVAGDASYAPAHRNLGVLLDLYLNDPTAALAEMEQYQRLSGEDKPVSGWIAELRHRTGVKPPVPVPVTASGPAPANEAAPAAKPAQASAATPYANGDSTCNAS
jgi:tetratricopeptide (TPR) repeat protein